MRRRRHDLLVLGLVTTFPAGLFGQFCQGLAGEWSDDYGYAWNISQSGFQGTTISGSISAFDDCNQGTIFDVYGTLDEVGDFSIDADYDPSQPVPPPCGVGRISYFGSLSGAGCETGSGTWSNDTGVTGSFNYLSKPCDAPATEVTSPSVVGWYNGATTYTFQANVVHPYLYFGGRPGYEGDAGPYYPPPSFFPYPADTCYDQFPNTRFPRTGPVPYITFDIDWNQGYFDLVGWRSGAVAFYRAAGIHLPCSNAVHQVMTIRCSSGANIAYKYNLLEGVIGDTYVQSYRDGLLASRPY